MDQVTNSVFELAFHPSDCKLTKRVLNHEQAASEPMVYPDHLKTWATLGNK